METLERAIRPLGAYEAIFARAERGNFAMAATFTGTVQNRGVEQDTDQVNTSPPYAAGTPAG